MADVEAEHRAALKHIAHVGHLARVDVLLDVLAGDEKILQVPLDAHKEAAVDGVDAMFIKDYKINDIVFVDVTILKAKDSATWISLKKSFEVPDPSPNFQRLIDEGTDIIATKIPLLRTPFATLTPAIVLPHPT